MMAKFLAILALALAVGSCVDALRDGGFMQSIGRKFNRRHHPGKFHHGGYVGQSSPSSGAGSASASAAASAASQPEPEYLAPEPHYYPPEPYYNAYQPSVPHHQPQHYYGYQPSVYSPPRYQPHGGSSSAASSAAAAAAGGSSAASSAASAANKAGRYPGGSGGAASSAASAAAAAKPQTQYYVPPTPIVNHYAYPRFAKPTVAYQAPALNIGSEIAAATSAAAASSTAGKVGGHHEPHLQGAHIPAEYGTHEVYRDEAPIHYSSGPQENHQFASSGVYGADNGVNENSYYKKSSEEERNHEDGSEESDHYLSTKSHGKAGEENLRIRQGRDDFDQEIGPYSVKTKKRNNFNFVDYNKSESETGTSVLQKDRHRSAYNKDTIKSREEIDAASTKYSNGRTESSGLKTKTYVDDEDSEFYDSAGVHGQHGINHGGAAAASSASAAAAAGNTASSSSAAGSSAGSH